MSIENLFMGGSQHTGDAHGGRLDPNCEECIMFMDRALITFNTSPERLLQANQKSINNPNITACLIKIINRRQLPDYTPPTADSNSLEAIIKEGETHSTEAHPNDASEIHKDCDTCMDIGLRLAEAAGTSPESLANSPTANERTKELFNAIIAYKRRRNGGESVWDS